MPTTTTSPTQQLFDCLERAPAPSWFVRATNDFGTEELFLRLNITGLYPRRYGPFDSETAAADFLNRFLATLSRPLCDLLNELDNGQRAIIEDTLARATDATQEGR